MLFVIGAFVVGFFIGAVGGQWAKALPYLPCPLCQLYGVNDSKTAVGVHRDCLKTILAERRK